jgi:predicted nucleic acid-binding protein
MSSRRPGSRTSRFVRPPPGGAAKRRLSAGVRRRLCAELEKDWPHYAVVEVSAPVCRLAAKLAERRSIRAQDAVQLACARCIRDEVGGDLVLACFDDRLNMAARAEVLTTA